MTNRTDLSPPKECPRCGDTHWQKKLGGWLCRECRCFLDMHWVISTAEVMEND